MYTAKFSNALSDDFLHMPTVNVGKVKSTGSPDIYVFVSRDSSPLFKVGVFVNDECLAFSDVRMINESLVVGYGHFVHFIHIPSGKVSSFELSGYFGHLYTLEEFDLNSNEFDVLVASATELIKFGLSGEVLWHSKDLGIDGIVIEEIQGDLIVGSGEWDPPGGWQQFKLKLANGQKII